MLSWYHNIAFALKGAGLVAFVRDAMVNHASSSLTLEATVAAVACVIWMGHATRRLELPGRWRYLLTTFVIAVAFVFPFSRSCGNNT